MAKAPGSAQAPHDGETIMLRMLSIRGRLYCLLVLLIGSLVASNLVLIQQAVTQSLFINEQAQNLELVVAVDEAVQTFGNLKYWITDYAVSQRSLSKKEAEENRAQLNRQLSAFGDIAPNAVAGLTEQVTKLVEASDAAAVALSEGNRLVGNAKIAQGRNHILAVDSRLSTFVSDVRAQGLGVAAVALAQTDQGIRTSVLIAFIVAVATALMTWFLVRSIVSPLKNLTAATLAMVEGNMAVSIPDQGRDEIGAMAKVLALFRDSVARRDKAEKVEAKLREVIENISEGFGFFDADDRLYLSNRNFRSGLHPADHGQPVDESELEGLSFEEVLRKSVSADFIEIEKGTEEAWITHRLSQHQNPTGPVLQKRTDGRWIMINEYITEDRGRVAIYRDISELKHREEKLRLQAQIIEQLYDSVIVVDLQGQITDWNRAAERTFGYGKDEMLGKTTASLYLSKEDATRYTAEMKKEMAETGRWIGECENRRKDGSIVYLEALTFQLRDDDGNVVSTIGVNRDITLRKQAQEALRQSEKRLTAVVDNMPATVYLRDREGRLILINRDYESFLGLTKEEARGRHLNDLLPAHIADEALDHDREVIEKGETVEREFFLSHPGADGRQERAQVSIKFPIFDAEGNVTSVGGVELDITERKRIQEELQRAKEQAEVATKAKSQFLANMSHELRTPMNAIIGFTRLVMRRSGDSLPQQQRDNLDKILVSADHLLSLINSVLDLSKIEAGQMEVSLSRLEVAPLVERCLRTMEPLFQEKGLTLTRQIDQGLLPIVSDDEKLMRVLLNLLSNGAKFTEAGGVTMAVYESQEGVVLEVKDTGVGIPEDELAKIFEEFHQIDSSSTRKESGTGLGLSITRDLVRLIGGRIEVESQLGLGSSFRVILPRATLNERLARHIPDSKAKTDPESDFSDVSVGFKDLVLVIDDDPNAIYLLRENLADAGYGVIGASNGREGLLKAKEIKPVAIVLDILMPEMDGWSVLTALKSDSITRSIPVIILSIMDQKDQGYQLGAYDYLLKPIDRDAMVETLAALKPQRRTLLLADDDPQMADIVGQILDEEDYQVEVVNSGKEALAALEARRPEALLLDLLMPEMDGFDVLDAIQQRPDWQELPVIILTAKDLTHEERQTLSHRARAVIEKQRLDRETLVSNLERLLAHHAPKTP
ncbi:MAG: PAS domain S-box protein [Pseudomonadota bacterium]